MPRVDWPLRRANKGSAIRVITAIFADIAAAELALAELIGLEQSAYADLKVAPFGRLGRDLDGDSAVLAGRLADEHVPDASVIVEDHGGLMISDLDARRTGWTDSRGPG